MKKLILITLPILLVFTAYAQKSKFGHVNSAAIFEAMPERAEAKSAIEKYAKQLEDQLLAMNSEFEQKYNAYLEEAETYSPAIKQSKEKELSDLQSRIQNFQMSAQTDLQNKEQELLEPIYNKIKDAIKQVGQENSFMYIYDISTLLYYSDESIDVTEMVKTKLQKK
ncbi:MAG TPA: OmpH family outer membrane protein [Bacteroidales bacterium]|mgnify:CR=1 FL=1|nr:OmpH family outer membrane protein [Bacteroidales bacterium]